jgi:hypothetical protein
MTASNAIEPTTVRAMEREVFRSESKPARHARADAQEDDGCAYRVSATTARGLL